jgi:hypothetical protein
VQQRRCERTVAGPSAIRRRSAVLRRIGDDQPGRVLRRRQPARRRAAARPLQRLLGSIVAAGVEDGDAYVFRPAQVADQLCAGYDSLIQLLMLML